MEEILNNNELSIEELQELLDKLYELKSKNIKEVNSYKEIINKLKDEMNSKKDILNNELSKYRVLKVINFLSFLLAFYTNNVITNYIDARILNDVRRSILELTELIIYIIPVLGVVDTETRNRDLKDEIKSLKEEIKTCRDNLQEHKNKYRHLIIENRTVEEMILSCYTRISDLEDKKKLL